MYIQHEVKWTEQKDYDRTDQYEEKNYEMTPQFCKRTVTYLTNEWGFGAHRLSHITSFSLSSFISQVRK